MPFKKGMQKTGGRTKGVNNNVSKEIREVSAMLLQGQLEALQDKLPTLKDSDYIKAIGLLMKHVLPAQKQIEVDTIQHPTEFQIEILDRIEQVSNDDLDNSIDEWVENQRNK